MHLLEQLEILRCTHLPNSLQHLRPGVHITHPLKQPRLLTLPSAHRRPSRLTSLLHSHGPLVDPREPCRFLQYDRDPRIRRQGDSAPHNDTPDRLRVCVVKDCRTGVRRRCLPSEWGDRWKRVRRTVVDGLHACINRKGAFQYLWCIRVLVAMFNH